MSDGDRLRQLRKLYLSGEVMLREEWEELQCLKGLFARKTTTEKKGDDHGE